MSAPAFQLYAKEFIASTMEMNAEEVGTYIRLLCFQWSNGSIPDDSKRLRQIAGASVSALVLAKFQPLEAGRMVCQWLMEYSHQQTEYREKQRQNGILSGAARRTKNERRLNHGSLLARTNGAKPLEPKGNSAFCILHSAENTPPPPGNQSTPEQPVEARREGAGDSKAADQRQPDPEALDRIRLIESVWNFWPKKTREVAAKLAIGQAIERHGVDRVLGGVRAVAEADARRNVTPPGRFLPDSVEFFEESRYLDDPAQYGPREIVQDEAALRRRVRELDRLIREHPGNPEGAYTEAAKVREKDGWRVLVREKRELVEKLGNNKEEES
jgi:uncharacterized protein YdaU (DUF1376 family)